MHFGASARGSKALTSTCACVCAFGYRGDWFLSCQFGGGHLGGSARGSKALASTCACVRFRRVRTTSTTPAATSGGTILPMPAGDKKTSRSREKPPRAKGKKRHRGRRRRVVTLDVFLC